MSATTLVVGLCLGFGSGCPPRDVGIRISEAGASYIADACESGEADCGVIHDASKPTGCCSLGITTSSVARIPSSSGALQARVFLLTTNGFHVQSASKCMDVPACTDGGVRSKGSRSDCLAEALNQQLDGAMPNGLTADGLRNADEALVVLAIYESSDQGCSLDTLVACAGLEPPLGGGSYDVTCASCRSGTGESTGSDRRPCPRPRPDDVNSCFLNYCQAWLQDTGLP